MAEAFAKHCGKGKVEAMSAGTVPSGEINPIVVEVMKEKGIDISKNKPKPIDMKKVEEADLMITMGCGAQDVCPAPLKKETIDWPLEDPKGKTIEEVRKIRDRIERKVLKLIAQF